MSGDIPPLLLGAGGRSSRMGRPKHSLLYHGATWLDWQLARFQAAGGRRVFVVLPGETPPPIVALPTLQVDWIFQPDPAAPMLASLGMAAAAVLAEGAAAAWWLPVDVPAPGPDLWRDLWARWRVDLHQAAVPAEGGHPVLLGLGLLERLAHEAPASGLRLDLLLRGLDPPAAILRGSVRDANCRLNLNTPAAWEDWLSGEAERERE